jgi:hypothetical protein
MQQVNWTTVLRIMLGVGLILLSLGAGAAAYWHFYLSPIPLTLAMAPAGSDISQFFTAFAENAKAAGSRVRLSIVPYPNIAETTVALDAGDVDLAYVRPDYRMPASGLALALLQPNIAVLVTCPKGPAARGPVTALSKSRPLARISGLKDLRGRRVAVLGQGPSNIALLERLLAFHGIRRDDVSIFRFGLSKELSAVDQSDAPDALFLAGARGEIRMAGGLKAFKCPGDVPATVLPITEGGMLAAQNKLFSMVDLAVGELAVDPPRPEETTSTLGFPSLLVARQDLSESTVEEFMKQLFASRQVLMSDHPAATRIEPLPTDLLLERRQFVSAFAQELKVAWREVGQEGQIEAERCQSACVFINVAAEDVSKQKTATRCEVMVVVVVFGKRSRSLRTHQPSKCRGEKHTRTAGTIEDALLQRIAASERLFDHPI